MTIKLTIPELGDSTTTGIVLSLLVEPGSTVDIGDNLIEVETDKVVMEVPTEHAGIINSFEINVGDTVAMGTEFALLNLDKQSPALQDDISDSNSNGVLDSISNNNAEQATQVVTSEEIPIVACDTTSVKQIDLTIPELGDSTTTGIVLSRLVEPGSKISTGDNLLEVETDKVVMEIPSEYNGIIDNFLLNVGDKVEMGDKFAKLTITEYRDK